jgi:hypothetical protein
MVLLSPSVSAALAALESKSADVTAIELKLVLENNIKILVLLVYFGRQDFKARFAIL